ncbi:YheT family hydrolase [Emticicia sp. SJ17W-69]|uniref:YheT family hydrolase n=1 Tax=Emticicia sp. SJ17W-69 TaxID=3421657 RepID=UPI003EBC67CA
MPILPTNSTYRPPRWQFNAHIQTIYPSLFRKIPIDYKRERVELPDGDFLDLDWSLIEKSNRKKLVIVTHGLEGDSTRHYVTGMVKKLNDNGYDGLGWNCRSCSGEMNRLPRFYHHGDIDDIRFVVNYAIEKYNYEEVILVGFSMGGSMTLRLMGEKPEQLPNQVKFGIAVSVPLDLFTSVYELYKPGRRFYMKRFIDKLGKKIKVKATQHPNNQLLNHDGYKKIKNFEQFDDRYTARMFGFKNAHDFYHKAAAKPFLKSINIPTLIIQAKNDPFLSPECLDLGDATNNPNLHLQLLELGGHVGFMLPNSNETWVECRVIDFINGHKN